MARETKAEARQRTLTRKAARDAKRRPAELDIDALTRELVKA